MKTIKIKLIVLGEHNVGKSSILNRYKTKKFIKDNNSTIGVDFFNYTIIKNNIEYILHIWDTSGQEKFNSIITTYYRNIAMVLLVFDISDKSSFKKLDKWFNNIDIYSNTNTIIKLIGNKCDKPKQITKDEINDLCESYKIDYIEVSAKNNINIDDIFINIINEIETKLIENIIIPNKHNGIIESSNTIKLDNIKKHERNKKCCNIL